MSVISFMALYYISHENQHIQVSNFKIFAHENKTYTVTSSPNCQLLLHTVLPTSAPPTKLAPPTPNLLCPLTFRLQVHVSTLSSIQKRVFFFANTKEYPLQILSTSTLLAHSPHPLLSACSHSTHSYTVLDKGEKMCMK